MSRRKQWDLALIGLAIGCGGVGMFAVYMIVWNIHAMLYPDRVGLHYVFLLFVLSVAIGFVLTNWIIHCIQPPSGSFNRQSKEVKQISLAQIISGFMHFAIVFFPICLFISMIGSLTLLQWPIMASG